MRLGYILLLKANIDLIPWLKLFLTFCLPAHYKKAFPQTLSRITSKLDRTKDQEILNSVQEIVPHS